MGPTFRRTRKGSEELVLRKHGLNDDQRKILLYANGNRSIEDFERVVPEVAESPEILAAMEELGFLEMFDPDLAATEPRRPDSSSERSAMDSSTAASGAPASDTESRLDTIKSKLARDVASILGNESEAALKRIERVESEDDLREVLRKMIDLVKLYAGTRKSETFIREYDKYIG